MSTRGSQLMNALTLIHPALLIVNNYRSKGNFAENITLYSIIYLTFLSNYRQYFETTTRSKRSVLCLIATMLSVAPVFMIRGSNVKSKLHVMRDQMRLFVFGIGIAFMYTQPPNVRMRPIFHMFLGPVVNSISRLLKKKQ